MANSWQNLHALVQSLTSAEKGYFKKHWSGFSGDSESKNREVFDLLAKMKKLDEDKLLQIIGGTPNTIKSVRTHLYKQILRSLRMFKNDNDLGYTLREYLDYIEILQKKRLYQQGMQFLEKGTLLAHDMKMQPYHLLFLIQQKQFLNQYSENEKNILALEISKKILSASELIIKREQIKSGHLKSLHWNNVFVPLRDETVKKESEILLHTLLQINANNIEDYSEKNLLFAALSNIYLLHGEIQSAIIYQQLSVEVMESLDVRKINRVLSYISALYNLASLCIYEKEYLKVELLIDKMQNVPLKSLHEKHFTNAITCCLKAQLLNHNSNDFILEKLVEIETQMGEEKPIPNLFYDTCFALMSYCVQHKQYDLALQRSHFLFQHKFDHSQISMHVHVRLMHILIHYKHNNIQLLPFLIRHTYRLMLKQELNYQLEKVLLRFFPKNSCTGK